MDDLEAAILNELTSHTVLSLATQGDTAVHAVNLMYAHDGFDMFWLSDPKTRHSQHLERGAAAAATIAGQYDDFREIRGLQMVGLGNRLTGDSEVAAFDLLTFRYPFLEKFAAGKLARHLGAAAVYRFRPGSITLIDNSKGFGFKQTLELGP